MARVGRRYFQNRSSRVKAMESDDAVHVLNPEERKGLKRVERGAVFRSALAGALSGGSCAAAEFYADAHWANAPVTYWAVLGGVTIVASVLEIAFVYWDTLRSVHELARVAGIELFGNDRQKSDDALIDSLARAALELPNPVDLGIGVNPHREAKKWQLLAASLAYKAKIGVTNFIIKLLIRRVLGRVLVRGALRYLPFVSLPVTAAWNGIVTFMVLRESRIRAIGPSASGELMGLLFGDTVFSAEGRLSAVRAVAAAIVRTQDLHPNLVRLLSDVGERAGQTVGAAELDDVGQFLEGLKTLEPKEQQLSLRILAVACVLDGRLSAREKQLWADAMSAAGKNADLANLENLRTAFVRGDGVSDSLLRAF
jgi:hypothetical protein